MNKKLVSGLLIFFLLFFLSLFFSSFENEINVSEQLIAPSLSHIFGTDALGRDLFVRTMASTLLSLGMALECALLVSFLSYVLAVISTNGTIFSLAVSALSDLLRALPTTLLAMLLLILFGGGRGTIVVVLTLSQVPQSVYLFKSHIARIKEENFVKAKLAFGMKMSEVMLYTVPRHMLPVFLVNFTFVFASSILAESSLSFIGAGIQLPSSSLGTLLSEGRTLAFSAPWAFLFPAAVLLLSVLSLLLISEGLESEADPFQSYKR